MESWCDGVMNWFCLCPVPEPGAAVIVLPPPPLPPPLDVVQGRRHQSVQYGAYRNVHASIVGGEPRPPKLMLASPGPLDKRESHHQRRRRHHGSRGQPARTPQRRGGGAAGLCNGNRINRRLCRDSHDATEREPFSAARQDPTVTRFQGRSAVISPMQQSASSTLIGPGR
jgi:hypothetical protein